MKLRLSIFTILLIALNTISATTLVNGDLNGDGTINILILGTNTSINNSTEAFSPNQIATELQNILSEDPTVMLDVNVVAENIHQTKPVTLGLGGSGTEYTWNHHSHSLAQYYYWPDAREERLANLSGDGDYDWDYVIIGADPYIISHTPGYYSLGVNKVAAKIAQGNAQPLLLMMWPKNETSSASVSHYEEFIYRTSTGAVVDLPVIPAGLTWNALPSDKKDVAAIHPTPNGAYLTASSIYAHIYGKSAATSAYDYDSEIADLANEWITTAANQSHFSGVRTFVSPFYSCNIGDEVINYNHTGSSSENGIKNGLNWVFNQSPKTFQNGGDSPIDFNYGRANTNFEPNKRYQINPELFDYSFGFPMQDHGNHGNTSMLYGLDKRDSGTVNDTDVGTARYMVQQSELPYARAIPIRTLYAQMKDAIPGQSAYRDSWHMHRNLDKAVAGYMYTLLNGTCVVGVEPTDPTSEAWGQWMSHKIGYETAWNFIYLEGNAPDCNSLSDEDADGYNSYVDCNDNDAAINPEQTEIVYNGIDEDCNPSTPDDDLDQDGFLLADDCDDDNNTINPDQAEEPYNGIDDDCNPDTFDDDLDQDGFLLADDCDDDNNTINPDQAEEPYNGIDDDCNPDTFDDDLDQDGFLLADDCDDTNENINPDAVEIPNNEIDEDCDGMDLVTSVHELENVFISIYPNLATEFINIDIDGVLDYEVTLYNLEGKILLSKTNSSELNIGSLLRGNYLLKIKDRETSLSISERIIITK